MCSNSAGDQHRAAKDDSVQRKRRKVIVFSVEDPAGTACGQQDIVGSADLASSGKPACQTGQAPVIPHRTGTPRTAPETQACSTDGQSQSRVSFAGLPTTATAAKESELPAGKGDTVLVNGAPAPAVHQFFLPSDEDEETDEVRELSEQLSVQDASAQPLLGLQNGIFQEAAPKAPAAAPHAKPGVQFLGPNHMFTVVPVGSGDLRTDNSETKTAPSCGATSVDGVAPIRRVSSAKSQIFPGCSQYYSPYSTVRAPPVTRRVSSNFLLGRGGQVAVPYNPYHTVTGLVPSSYQGSEGGLRRVSTSKREYGVGGGGPSLPPSLASLVLPQGSTTSGPSIVSGLHRVRTLPCQPTTSLRRLSKDVTNPPEAWAVFPPSEHNTVHSVNQMTVRSAGGISIDVGSTDGRNVKIHGAVESPEQLPLLPSFSG